MPFYAFDQNNSGGGYDHDARKGIGQVVVIEAEDSEEAIYKAEEIGLYFDGRGDCSCCGNRWSTYSASEEMTFSDVIYWDWRKHVYIHLLNGKILEVNVTKTQATVDKENEEYRKRYGRY